MWSLFSQKRDLDAEVYAKLRPGDLYPDDGAGWPPELLVRYLLLANASVMAFVAVLLFRVPAEAPAHEDLVAAVWLTSIGMAIAVGAWTASRLSRRGEGRALSSSAANGPGSALSPAVQAMMKQAAIRKMLAFRLMIVSAIASCLGLYAALKGVILL